MGNRHSVPGLAVAVSLVVGTTGWLVACPPAQGVEPPDSLTAPVFNGVPTTGFPAVGLLTYPEVECTVTLIGCSTVLTAAHCACFDFSSSQGRLLIGDACRNRPDLLDPAGKRVFFQHAGFYELEEIVLHPLWGEPGEPGHDLAILRLDRPVEGVLPVAINRRSSPSDGTQATLVGFGRTSRDVEDQSIKRTGRATTVGECPDHLVCWRIDAPLAPPGEEAGLCFNDSGGPLFADMGGELGVIGVAQSISNGTCGPPNLSSSTDVFRERRWIEEAAGLDFGTRWCGDLPQLPRHPAARADGASGRLSPEEPEALFTFDVLPTTRVLRLALNGEGVVRPASNDFDLFVGPGSLPDPEWAAACAATSPESLEFCQVEDPEPGPWSIRVWRARGEGELQVVATQLGAVEPPADPPNGGWLVSDDLPGFEVKVRFGDAAERLGEAVPGCIAETLCVSGALADRPELFVKVIGPRPNGYLWVQVSRFTPSRAEVWIRRTATGTVRHYVLDPVGPTEADVSGLQDRQAFLE